MDLPACPALMTIEQFGKWHSIGKTTAYECAAGKSKNYPPVAVKTLPNGRKYITAEAAADWRNSLPDA